MFIMVLAMLLPVSASNKRELLPCLSNVKIKLDGVPDEQFWQKAGKIDDFLVYRTYKDAEKLTTVRICLDENNCYVALECDEPLGVNRGNPEGSAWSGDFVEIFLGSVTGKDWYRQIVFGLNDKTYNEFIDVHDISRAMKIDEKHWSAELVIPRRALGEFRDTLLFNVMRGRSNAKHSVTWGAVAWAVDLHRFGIMHIYTPEDEIIRGPWCSISRATEAVVSFETAGSCAMEIFYRKKGEKDFNRVFASVEGSVQDASGSLHHVRLTGLEPDTVYEYHAGDQNIRTFTTLTPVPTDFSFAVATDTHGRDKSLRNILKNDEVSKADIFIHLGDMITGIAGHDSFYNAYLSAMSDLWQKPFFSLRGNHEYRGNAPKVFFDMLYPFERKAYYSFNYKGVCFVILDFDGDLMHGGTYIADQREWLKNVVKSSEFTGAQFRVLLAHQPLLAGRGGGKLLGKFFSELPEKDQQAFDLMLAGHVHIYEKAMPGEKYIFSQLAGRNGKIETMPLTFPVLIGESDGWFIIDKKADKLTVKAYGKASDKPIDELVIKRK